MKYYHNRFQALVGLVVIIILMYLAFYLIDFLGI